MIRFMSLMLLALSFSVKADVGKCALEAATAQVIAEEARSGGINPMDTNVIKVGIRNGAFKQKDAESISNLLMGILRDVPTSAITSVYSFSCVNALSHQQITSLLAQANNACKNPGVKKSIKNSSECYEIFFDSIREAIQAR